MGHTGPCAGHGERPLATLGLCTSQLCAKKKVGGQPTPYVDCCRDGCTTSSCLLAVRWKKWPVLSNSYGDLRVSVAIGLPFSLLLRDGERRLLKGHLRGMLLPGLAPKSL